MKKVLVALVAVLLSFPLLLTCAKKEEPPREDIALSRRDTTPNTYSTPNRPEYNPHIQLKPIGGNHEENPNAVTFWGEENPECYYIIQKGDTISKIVSERPYTSIERLKELNNLKNPDLIYLGQKINLYECE